MVSLILVIQKCLSSAKAGDVISVFIFENKDKEYTITIKDENRKNIHAIVKLNKL